MKNASQLTALITNVSSEVSGSDANSRKTIMKKVI
jgi:hypothetical protein